MNRMKDTPRRYVWRGMWGISAIEALRLIAVMRRSQTRMGGRADAELDVDRRGFITELKRENARMTAEIESMREQAFVEAGLK